jgi:hypothetical protein
LYAKQGALPPKLVSPLHYSREQQPAQVAMAAGLLAFFEKSCILY